MNEDGTPLRRRTSKKVKEAETTSPASPAVEEASSTHNGTIQLVSCIIAIVLLTAYLYFRSEVGSFPNITGLYAGEGEQRGHVLDEHLHPEEHIYRNATTAHYTWRITSDIRAPDGVRKKVYLVNGEFVSPTIEARPGDTLIIDVENGLDEDASLHWHGLRMKGANEMDGAVGLTQCPIPPGGSFTYKFELDHSQHVSGPFVRWGRLRIEPASSPHISGGSACMFNLLTKHKGTFWWHAHDQTERADGLYGGLVIHKPAETAELDHKRFSYDEERLLLVGDWYHRPAKEVMAWYMRAGSFGNEPVPDSLIVNGLGAYNCSDAGLARPVECSPTHPERLPYLVLDKSKSYRFRVVNVGSLAGFTLSFTDAQMTAITLDGAHEIVGEPARSIGVLHPGERVDIVVRWAQNLASGSHPELQIELDDENFRYANPALTMIHSFPIHDRKVSSGSVNTSPIDVAAGGLPVFSLATANASRSAGKFRLREANKTILLYATTKKLAKLHNLPFGFFNQTSWKPQKGSLPLLGLPRSAWDENQLVPFVSSSSEEPRIVDIVINNIDDGSHPFHLHGYDAYVLSNCADGSYWGSYDPFNDPVPPCGAYNLEDPVLRDTVVVPRRGYVVLRLLADNPGIWMLHCHLLWHQAAGMAMGIHVGEGDDSETSVMSKWHGDRAQRLLDSCTA